MQGGQTQAEGSRLESQDGDGMFKFYSNLKVKAAVNTLDVARQLGLEPIRKGERHWLCCPFHGERTPSLAIYPGNRGYYCFGCGRSGDAIDFYAGIKKMSMKEALEELSEGFCQDDVVVLNEVCYDSEFHNKKRAGEITELDRLIKRWRLIGSLLEVFGPDDELPDEFWDLVTIRADLELRIDEMCHLQESCA